MLIEGAMLSRRKSRLLFLGGWALVMACNSSSPSKGRDPGTGSEPDAGLPIPGVDASPVVAPIPSPGFCGCSSDDQCVAEADARVNALRAPASWTEPRFVGAECVARDERNSRSCCYARPAVCLCSTHSAEATCGTTQTPRSWEIATPATSPVAPRTVSIGPASFPAATLPTARAARAPVRMSMPVSWRTEPGRSMPSAGRLAVMRAHATAAWSTAWVRTATPTPAPSPGRTTALSVMRRSWPPSKLA
jgi:hypothetical protein